MDQVDHLKQEQNGRYELLDALYALRAAKPEERGELSRRYAVAITELEKVVAYFDTFIVMRAHWPKE